MARIIGYLIVGVVLAAIAVSGFTTNTGILQTPAQKAVAPRMADVRAQIATRVARPTGTPVPKG